MLLQFTGSVSLGIANIHIVLSSRLGSAHAQDLKRLLFDSSVPQTIFLPDPGGGSFPVAV